MSLPVLLVIALSYWVKSFDLFEMAYVHRKITGGIQGVGMF
jgi:hypothetical protein